MDKNILPRQNVFGQQLQITSTDPMTGFLRNGYCDTSRFDHGSHTVAAEVTEEFLDFSAQRGNDLRESGQIMGGPGAGFFPGLKGGCKWCLCAARWKEAFDARERYGDKIVPKILLESTHMEALKTVSLEELKQFAMPSSHTAGKSEL